MVIRNVDKFKHLRFSMQPKLQSIHAGAKAKMIEL